MSAATQPLGPAGAATNREAARIIRRALGYVRPLWLRFAGKAVLASISVAAAALLPWPLKILVDHVVLKQPIGASPTTYPVFVQPFVTALEGASRVEIALAVSAVGVGLILLIGAFGTRGAERDGTYANLASGLDTATRTENEANSAGSRSSGLLGLIEFRFTLRLSHLLNHHYRSHLFERVKTLPMTTFDDERIGDAIYRVMYDTPAITQLCYQLILIPLLSPLQIAITVWILQQSYAQAPVVIWIGFLALPLGMLITVPFSGALRRRSEASREAGSVTTTTIEEGMTNILAVQSLGALGRERRRFDRDSWQSFGRFRAIVALLAAMVLTAGAIFLGLGIWVFYVLTDLIFEGRLTVGDLAVVYVYYGQIAGSAYALAVLWIRLQANVPGLRRVFFLMDLPAETDAPDARPLPPVRRGIELADVHYHYPDGTPALRGVSLRARVGELVALVGPAGAGKTTLAYTIPRFLEPQQGRVLADGVDLARVTRESLRAQIAFVFQETVLFDASAADNIRVAHPGASDEEVRRAAELAGADAFLRRLPEGYATRLGRNGSKLSGGQKQRLAIARALVRPAPIVILDEPTSALDPETERRVIAALHEASRTRLVIVIAHRLSTVRAADQILFVDDGRIRERGTHAELMARPDGAYRRYVDLQTGGGV